MGGRTRGNRTGRTVRTLVLIGLLFQLAEVLGLLALGLYFVEAPVLGGTLLLLAGLGVGLVLLVYVYVYGRIVPGDYRGARGPTLALGILSLLTLSLLSGILYLIAYSFLDEADALVPGRTGAVRGGRPCPVCGFPNPPGGRSCGGCREPLG